MKDKILKIKDKQEAHPVAEFFLKRFSPRSFSSKKIPVADLETVFAAVRWTPSSYNRQPWYFYVAEEGSSSYKKILSTLSDSNKVWVQTVPVLILACYIAKDEYGQNSYAQYDLGQSVATLVYQAQILGLYSHQMAGFDKKKVSELLSLPEDHKPWVVIALGYLGSYDNLPEEVLSKELLPPKRKDQIYTVLK